MARVLETARPTWYYGHEPVTPLATSPLVSRFSFLTLLHTNNVLSAANSAKKKTFRVMWTKVRYISSRMNRRTFLELAAAGVGVLPISRLARTKVWHRQAVTVLGPIAPERLGRTLIHEHVMVDFIGADAIRPGRYDPEEVFLKALPHLHQVKSAGCDTLVDCTPAYIGRDAGLLRRLSQASGLQIVTNTGLYGAAQNKYVPRFAYAETAQQLAAR